MRKTLNKREVIKILEDNGYKKVKQTGGHMHYVNSLGKLAIVNQQPNKMVVQRMFKELGIAY